ncbi:MAG: tRNA (adenosine(37)-N6)-threonylcarbamoyltransferase complex dimerization subunit type 1 TsaB [Candidatus Babeliaceae bacterium]
MLLVFFINSKNVTTIKNNYIHVNINNKSLFLVIYGGYNQIQLALIGPEIKTIHTENHKNASKNILIILDEMLKKHNKKLWDCAFIAVYQGPGPYTTLRTVIATVNGLAFATKIPLLGINGLETFVQENHSASYTATIALLNAFGKDVYYGIYTEKDQTMVTGCLPFDDFVQQIQNIITNNPTAKIKCIGNAVLLYRQELIEKCGNNLIFPEPLPLQSSLEGIIQEAQKKWHFQENISEQLMPLYLKKSL